VYSACRLSTAHPIPAAAAAEATRGNGVAPNGSTIMPCGRNAASAWITFNICVLCVIASFSAYKMSTSTPNSLAAAFADAEFDEYDVVLLDCAPNFTMVTRTGIVASDHIVVPAKPDYLSTLGIDYLRRKLSELVGDYNRAVGPGLGQINPTILGVVLTMVQYGSGGPIIASRNYIAQPGSLEVPVFRQLIRESKTLFATAGETGIPAVLAADGNPTVQYELQELTNEFLAKIRI